MTTPPKTLMEIFMEESEKANYNNMLKQAMGNASSSVIGQISNTALSSLHGGVMTSQASQASQTGNSFRQTASLRANNVEYDRLAAPGTMATAYRTSSGKRRAVPVVTG